MKNHVQARDCNNVVVFLRFYKADLMALRRRLEISNFQLSRVCRSYLQSLRSGMHPNIFLKNFFHMCPKIRYL